MASKQLLLPSDTLTCGNPVRNTFSLSKPPGAQNHNFSPNTRIVKISRSEFPSTLTRNGGLRFIDTEKMRISHFSSKEVTKYAVIPGKKCVAKAEAMVSVSENSMPSNPSLDSLKSKLLRGVAGLDRGLAATDKDAEEVEVLSRNLERNGRSVELPEDLESLQGQWRLVYSSGFLSGSLGGQRPGPPVGKLPLTLGQVFQRVDVASQGLDNIVTLQFGPPWPLPSFEVTATLAHTMETFGKAGIRIIFEKTSVKGEGPLKDLPTLTIPQLPEFLRPPSGLRSGEFETTYLDEDLRVSRGDRGELRIFVKA